MSTVINRTAAATIFEKDNRGIAGLNVSGGQTDRDQRKRAILMLKKKKRADNTANLPPSLRDNAQLR